MKNSMVVINGKSVFILFILKCISCQACDELSGTYGRTKLFTVGLVIKGIMPGRRTPTGRVQFQNSFQCRGTVSFPDDREYNFWYNKSTCEIHWDKPQSTNVWRKNNCEFCREKVFGNADFKGEYRAVATPGNQTFTTPCIYNTDQQASVRCNFREDRSASWGSTNLQKCKTKFEKFCREKVFGNADFKGEYRAVATPGNQTFTTPCIYNTEQQASVRCNFREDRSASWGSTNLQKCKTKFESTDRLLLLQERNLCRVRNESTCLAVQHFAQTLRDIVVVYNINIPQDLVLTTSIIDTHIAPGLVGISIEVVEGIFNHIFEILEIVLSLSMPIISKAQIQGRSSSSFVKFLDDIAINYIELLKLVPASSITPAREISINGSNIAMAIKQWTNKDAFIVSRNKNNKTIVEITSNNTNVSSDVNSLIKIPAEAISDNDFIYSYYFCHPFFFMSEQTLLRSIGNTSLFTRAVQSNVMSAKVGNKKTANLTTPVTLTFKKSRQKNLAGNNVCHFWVRNITTSIENVAGGWISDGCIPVPSKRVSDYFSCECDHLTNFALLLDVSGRGETSLEVSIVTWVGCGLSLLGLTITIASFVAFRSYRKKLAHKLILSLSLSLMTLLIVFLVGIEKTSDETACKVLGALIHYFMLTTFAWMCAQAVCFYRSFVIVFNAKKDGNSFFIKSSVIAWGIPAVIVSITASIAHDNYANDNICMVTGNIFYATVVAPIAAIILFNTVVIVVVLRALHKSFYLPGKTQSTSNLRLVRIGFSCNVLLGITWLFGLLAVGDASLVFQWLFCIFNSLQGFFIFVLYVLRDNNITGRWRSATKQQKSSIESTSEGRQRYLSNGTIASYASQ